MKKIFFALFYFLCFISTGNSSIDDREYVDWGKYPNIVKIISDNQALCTGTEIGDGYIITAAHCVDGFKSFSIFMYDGTQVPASLIHKLDATSPYTDLAILQISKKTESKYILSDYISSDIGEVYGFGGLRILTDEELTKIRLYMTKNKYYTMTPEQASDLLTSYIPEVGYIYNDSDKLKKSPCYSIRNSTKGIEAASMISEGNSGGSLIIDNNKIIGVVAKGDMLGDGAVFAPVSNIINWYKKQSDKIDNSDDIFALNDFDIGISDSLQDNKNVPDFLQNKTACDGKTPLSTTILHNISSQSINKVSLQDVKPFLEKYYYCSEAAMLMNYCGDLIAKDINLKERNIQSMEHKNGKYKIVTYKKLLFSKCINKAPQEWKSILRKLPTIPIIYMINDNDPTYFLYSYDDGHTFYKNSEQPDTNGAYAVLFTKKQLANMPLELKECLGIK